MRMLPPYFKNFYKWTVWRTVYAFLGDFYGNKRTKYALLAMLNVDMIIPPAKYPNKFLTARSTFQLITLIPAGVWGGMSVGLGVRPRAPASLVRIPRVIPSPSPCLWTACTLTKRLT